MRYQWVMVGLLALLVLGCAREAPKEVQKQVSDMVERAEEIQKAVPSTADTSLPDKETQSTPTLPESPEKVELPQVIQDLIGKTERLKSYQYRYGRSPNLLSVTQTWVKGSRVRLELPAQNQYDPATYYNAIYLDVAAGTAAGYCTDRTRCRERTNEKVAVDYQSVRPKLAREWLDEIDPNTVQVLQTETVENRPAARVQYLRDGLTVDMWLDETYGLPLKIVVNTADPVTHKFGEMSVNTVTDADFVEPVKS